MNARDRFDTLRARYVAAQERYQEHDRALHSKYGRDVVSRWLSRPEAKKQERLLHAVGKAGDAFMAHLNEISPRDWSYGVPIHWLYEKLTFEDAVRPANGPLSCTPPLSYGATVPRT